MGDTLDEDYLKRLVASDVPWPTRKEIRSMAKELLEHRKRVHEHLRWTKRLHLVERRADRAIAVLQGLLDKEAGLR